MTSKREWFKKNDKVTLFGVGTKLLLLLYGLLEDEKEEIWWTSTRDWIWSYTSVQMLLTDAQRPISLTPSKHAFVPNDIASNKPIEW